MAKSNALVWALGGALVIALLVIAFLLGRESRPIVAATPGSVGELADSRGRDIPRAAALAERAASSDELRGAAATRDHAAPAAAPRRDAVDAPADVAAPAGRAETERAAAGSMARPGAESPTSNDDHHAAVRAYLARVDAIQVGPSGSPQSFAQELLAASMGGDLTRFDELVRELGDAEARIAGIAPPAAAADHHRALLGQVRESRGMMARLREALGKKDHNALSAMLGEVKRMQTAAEQLQREDQALRARL